MKNQMLNKIGLNIPGIFLALLLMLILIVSLFFVNDSSAQTGPALIRYVRSIETTEIGLVNPVGLAYSPNLKAFRVVESHKSNLMPPFGTDVISITQFEKALGSSKVEAIIGDPINLTFDSFAGRLLFIQNSNNSLIEVIEDSEGQLDLSTFTRHDVRSIDLQEPVGMSVDSSNGDILILDGVGPRIIIIEPLADNNFDAASASEIDLSQTGLGDVRGLAFDRETGHYFIIDQSANSLYEINKEGSVISFRQLSELNIENPQGMVFAPSSDQTDNPDTYNLFLADAGQVIQDQQTFNTIESLSADFNEPLNQGSPGEILELSFDQIQAVQTASFTGLLVNTIEAWKFSPPSPDSSGITYLSASNSLLISDSEVNEMTIYSGANVFRTTLSGSLSETFTTLAYSNEPTGVTVNPGNQHLFFSDDTGTRSVYELNPGPDGDYQTADDIVTSFSTELFGSNDPEGVVFDPSQGVLFVVDGVNAEVYRVSPGTNGLFDGEPPAGDDQVSSFDTAQHGITDPEGIALNQFTGNLYVVGRPADTLAELTNTGNLVQTLDISAANAVKPAGLVYAPSSQNPSEWNIYIAARGVDNGSDPNENDGEVYELTMPPSGPAPPVANDDNTSTVLDTPVTIDVAVNDSDPNGNLDPASANVDCNPSCSNPTDGTLVNNGDGTFTYTPDVSFVGDDSFVYEICDTDSQCDTATVSITVGGATIEVRVSASSDDAEERVGGNLSLTSSDIELVFDSGGDQTAGLRFNGINIPQGVNITNAYVQFQTDEANTVATTLTIQGEDVDNAATFVDVNFNITSRPKTNAAIPWSPPAWNSVGEASLDQQTPDISSIIQEIIDRPGWTPSNSLAIIISGTGERTAEAFDGVAAAAPLLHVEYVSGGTAPQVTINSPLDGASFNVGNPVTFVGTANDSEDGDLSNNLSWESNIDGPIGSGGSISRSDLSVGLHTITATATDSGGLTHFDQISLTINGLPVAIDDTTLVAEDGSINISVLTNDDFGGDGPSNSAITISSPASNGTATVNNGGSPPDPTDDSVDYTPVADFHGSDSFTYQICDSNNDCVSAMVNITITGVNDPPTAANDTGSVSEGGTLNEIAPGVLSNDTDPENDPLSVNTIPVSDPSNGILTLNADGSYSYLHDGSETTSDSFVYEVSDGNGGTGTAIVNITINAVNDPPVGNDDSGVVAQGGTINEIAPGVLANDTDPENDPLSVNTTPVSGPSNGILTLNADGSYSYQHNGSETTSDSFVYELSDGNGGINTATVNITITGVNDPPIANDDTGSVSEGGTLNEIAPGVLSNDTDPENDPLSVNTTPVSGPSNGILTLNADGSYSYQHDGSETTSDSFVYEVSDGFGGTDVATVNITINAVNDPPVGNDDSGVVSQGGFLNEVTPGVLSNDTDPENDPLSVNITPVSGPTNGILTLNADGSYSYQHDGSETTSDSFVYEVSDGNSGTDTATVNITITGVNDPPTAADDTGSVSEGGILNEGAPGVLANDTDPENDPLSVNTTHVSGPSNGILTLNADGSYSYEHDGSETTSDSFVYEVSDGNGGIDTATVNITITGVNDAPIANDDTGSIAEGGILNEVAPGVLANDSDPENDPLSVNTTPVSGPSNGILTLNVDGSYSYEHDGSETTSDSFVYEVSDGNGATDTATVNITIMDVNDAPSGNDDTYSTDEGVTLNVLVPGVLINDTDAENNPLTAVLNSPPSNGNLNLNPDGSFSYSPTGNFTGTDTFTYVANDGSLNSNITTVTITVLPVSNTIAAYADSDLPVSGTVTGDFTITYLDDGSTQSVLERESGGKPENRYSYLEHKWTINVAPGNVVTFYVNAWSSGSIDGDYFVFSYSTDDVSYTDMVTISNTADEGEVSFVLPDSIQGTIYIRVNDTNRFPGNQSLDTIFIDHMYIQSETEAGNPPSAPTGLSAIPITFTQIDLSWTDSAVDEFGFYIERSEDAINWLLIQSASADSTAYSDTTAFPNTTYYYRVQAYNGSGSSSFSNTAIATTPDGLNLTASGYKFKGAQTVDLSWSGGSAVSFDIFRDGILILSGHNEYSYTDNIGLKGGGSYQYQVCAAGSTLNCSNIVEITF